MKIVMLDRNSIIDRRIVLEAEALIEQGHQVELVRAEGSLGEWDQHKFKVTQFSLYPESAGETVHPSIDTAPIQEFREKWQGWIGKKPALLLGAILNPGVGKKFAMVAQSLQTYQRYILLLILSLVTFDVQTAGSAFGTLAGMVSSWVRNKFAQKCYYLPLEYWERRVVDYLAGQKFDVVHVHDLPALPLGAYIKKRFGCNLVYDAHELYSYQPGLSEKTAKQMREMENRFIHDADLVVLINNEQAAIMTKDFGEFPFVSLTNATTEPKGFSIDQKYDVIREKCGLSADSKILLFQGGINRVRKIHLLLEGVAKARSKPHMVFLTWGSEIEEFRALADELGIADRCHFLNPIPWDEMIYWAAAADVGVMPYQADDMNTKISSPNKMYEFIVAGTPMIASDQLINVKKVVGENAMGEVGKMVEGQDYADLIDRVLEPERHVMYRANIRRLRESYSWRVLSAPFISAYDQLANGGKVQKFKTFEATNVQLHEGPL